MEKSVSSWNVYFLSVFCHTAHFFLLGQQQILLILRKWGYARHKSQHDQQGRKKEKIIVKKGFKNLALYIGPLCIFSQFASWQWTSCFISPGKPADIHYGTGAIAGFFSEDSVTLGDLVVKDQVCSFICAVLCSKFLYWLSIVTSVSLGQFLILWGCCSRNLLKLQRSQALLSWLQNLMVFLVWAFRKYLLAMQYQCGKLFAPFKVQILFVHYSCQLCVSLCI